jgi:hypothetical protein
MAWLERRRDRYWLNFVFGAKKLQVSPRTDGPQEAKSYSNICMSILQCPLVNEARSSSGGLPAKPLSTARRIARIRRPCGPLRASYRSIATRFGERNREWAAGCNKS